LVSSVEVVVGADLEILTVVQLTYGDLTIQFVVWVKVNCHFERKIDFFDSLVNGVAYGRSTDGNVSVRHAMRDCGDGADWMGANFFASRWRRLAQGEGTEKNAGGDREWCLAGLRRRMLRDRKKMKRGAELWYRQAEAGECIPKQREKSN
jgi:hypothetical protein